MLEIPEARVIAEQMEVAFKGRRVVSLIKNASPHGFAFFNDDLPMSYADMLVDRPLEGVKAWGGRIEMVFGENYLDFNDGVNLRYLAPGAKRPPKHQLLLEFDDGSALVATVQMYGGLFAYPEGGMDNFYQTVARELPNPLDDGFDAAHFGRIVEATEGKESVKALLATKQRIPGLGNGCLQDILFRAGIHPKRKVSSLSDADVEALYRAIKEVLRAMTEGGGRNTEKDLYGKSGGYETALSAKTLKLPCPVCAGPIVRKAYLGGNVYYCEHCQPLG